MIAELLQELLTEFHQKMAEFNGSTPRDYTFPELSNKIKVAIGMRRTGKTYLLLQTVKQLLAQSIPLQRILYVNFEDDRLAPLTQEKLRDLIDDFYSLYPENHNQLCYLFLDEIQNVEEWSLVIRRYFDSKKTQIYLTGSSAKLLSKEIATSLRGRSFAIEVWPFSFTEYLQAKQIILEPGLQNKKSRDFLHANLLQYLQQGGFPETVKTVKMETPDRVRILQDYVDVVIFRDIVERHKITNITLIKYMIKLLLKNAGSLFTVNKLFNDLKSQGFNVGKTTLHDYLSYIEDSYLAFTMPLYSESIRKTQSNPKKVYAIDPGLINAYTFSFSDNLGHLFENMIYLDLKRKGHDVYYYLTENRYEVDFYTRDLYGKQHLYQVVWDNKNSETMRRETRALEEAEKELGIKGEIITPEIYLQSWINK